MPTESELDCLRREFLAHATAHDKIHEAEAKVVEARLSSTRYLVGTLLGAIPVIAAIIYFVIYAVRGGH